MKIYVVTKTGSKERDGLEIVELIEAYSDKQDAKAFCEYENKKLKTESIYYTYEEVELY